MPPAKRILVKEEELAESLQALLKAYDLLLVSSRGWVYSTILDSMLARFVRIFWKSYSFKYGFSFGTRSYAPRFVSNRARNITDLILRMIADIERIDPNLGSGFANTEIRIKSFQDTLPPRRSWINSDQILALIVALATIIPFILTVTNIFHLPGSEVFTLIVIAAFIIAYPFILIRALGLFDLLWYGILLNRLKIDKLENDVLRYFVPSSKKLVSIVSNEVFKHGLQPAASGKKKQTQSGDAA